jgi:nicotinamidase-related amidase
MKNLLVVVDMQNDFITGALANPEGQKIVGKVADYIRNFDGHIVYTMDSHSKDFYMETQEGQKLPVPHCIAGTSGQEIVPEVREALESRNATRNIKHTFGSTELGKVAGIVMYDTIYFVGVCTDICVISNAMLCKAFAPETRIVVLKDMCAGVTPESHETALKAMQACQIDIE